MKKFLIATIITILLLSVCACTSVDEPGKNASSIPQSSYSGGSNKGESSHTTSSKEATSSKQNSDKETTSSKQNSDKETTSSKDDVSDMSTDIIDTFFIKNNHTPLDKEKYYQYTFLNNTEKEAYRRIRNAVFSYNFNVKMSDLSLDDDRKFQLMECFFADYPQCFWLGSTYGISLKGDIILVFSDGKNDGSSTSSNVDFSKIDEQRKKYNQVIYSIVSKISPKASQYEKELAIHDYLTRTVSYDRVAENNPFVDGVQDMAYNSYGTLVENRAVCTGYTAAFQYLCYVVGINSNIVKGDSHMWNTVQIDNEWYQVDVTWDDPIMSDGSSGDGRHTYFNLTSAQMYAAHPRTTDDWFDCIKVPNCTATKNAYH